MNEIVSEKLNLNRWTAGSSGSAALLQQTQRCRVCVIGTVDLGGRVCSALVIDWERETGAMGVFGTHRSAVKDDMGQIWRRFRSVRARLGSIWKKAHQIPMNQGIVPESEIATT